MLQRNERQKRANMGHRGIYSINLVGAAEQREQVESPYAGSGNEASFRPSVSEVYFSYLRFAWFRTWRICR